MRAFAIGLAVLILISALSRGSAFANVGIGTNAPQGGLDVATTGTSSSLLVPRDNTGNRPTGVNGMIRYNVDYTAFEGFANGAWMQFATQTPGATVTATPSGPPAGTTVFAPTSTTCNFSPSYGSCAQVTNGFWPANGSTYPTCVNFPTGSSTITLDYGSSKTFGNVYVTMYADGAYMYLGVSFSVDNSTYTSSFTFTTSGYNAQYGTTAVTPVQTARYIRLTNGAANSYANNNYICTFAAGP